MRLNVLTNAPNIVSLSRLPMGVAFIMIDDTKVRLGLLVAAAITDGLDGWLARSTGSRTPEGAIIDPLTDHAFVIMALAAYIMEGSLTLGQALILGIRDIATSIAWLVTRAIPALRWTEFEARTLGKAVTGLQLMTLIGVLLMPASPDLLVPIVGMVSVAAIVDYGVAFWKAQGERRRRPRPGPTGA
jgi:cardiolipin synthase (CMP-forming)